MKSHSAVLMRWQGSLSWLSQNAGKKNKIVSRLVFFFLIIFSSEPTFWSKPPPTTWKSAVCMPESLTRLLRCWEEYWSTLAETAGGERDFTMSSSHLQLWHVPNTEVLCFRKHRKENFDQLSSLSQIWNKAQIIHRSCEVCLPAPRNDKTCYDNAVLYLSLLYLNT